MFDPVEIRFLGATDLKAVLDIERDLSDQWTFEELRAITNHTCDQNTRAIAAVRGGLQCGFLCGYAVYELHRDRLHLVRIVTRMGIRRTGVATAMINQLKRGLSPQRIKILADVPEDNLPMQLLLRETNFRATRVLRDYFERDDGQSIDAYQFQFYAVCGRTAPVGI